MRPVNPYAPSSPLREAFDEGVAAAMNASRPDTYDPNREVSESARPMSDSAGCQAMRASSCDMLLMRAGQLRAEAAALEQLAKFAVPMAGTPADEALWKMVVNQRG